MTRERWPSELGPWAGTQAAVARTDTGSGFRVGGVCLPRWELRLLGGRFFSCSPPLNPGSHNYELFLDAVFLKFLTVQLESVTRIGSPGAPSQSSPEEIISKSVVKI